MSAYNYRLHEAILHRLQAEIETETEYLLLDNQSDFGALRYRLGKINGLRDALAYAEDERQRILET